MSVQEAEERRRLFASSTGRSVSAPPRKKWYKRVPYQLRRMGSQQNILQDRIVSRRLVGAITMWHDIHANLLQLSIDRAASTSSSETEDNESLSSDSCESLYIDEDTSQPSISRQADNSKEGDSNHESESMDTVNEIHSIKNSNMNGKMSISNPELTSGQLKAMFPELSEHWSHQITVHRWSAHLRSPKAEALSHCFR
ncbi:hypothetical protein QR680_001565 [Steinernema hermaphroditum]|uniref:Uncharacterized protein n=1 Tax=Steinernema hermaphroditum TaxID=289476 RepID=A0AA39LG77_9BILA|nr:hypothetical protein QR680_001565 [Steinernema hermaphroditum]